MLTQRIKPYFLVAILSIGGLTLVAATPANAADCACESACLECPPNACDCPCSCDRPRHQNFVYKTLDTVAGGIERLLGLDKLNCDSCEGAICDDGCDAAMLEAFSESTTPMHLLESLPTVPEQHQLDAPIYRSQSPGTDIRFGQPMISEPYIPTPETFDAQPLSEPEFAPQIQQADPLTNPFLDDANVMPKRRVRATNYQQSKTQKSKASSNKPASAPNDPKRN